MNIANACKNNAGSQAIYPKMCRDEEISVSANRDQEQKVQRAKKGTEYTRLTQVLNLVNNVQVLENMVHHHPYVQQIIY